MNIFEEIENYYKNGEILKFVYNGGSQPGTVREAIITSLNNENIKARYIDSRLSKEFKMDKIEIYNDILHKNLKIYIAGQKENKYINYQDIVDIHSDLFKEKELILNIEKDSFALFQYYKNGNLKKSPVIALEYHEFIYNEYYDIEDNSFKSDKYKSEKPWCLKIKGKTTRNYKHFEKAVETFIDCIKAF